MKKYDFIRGDTFPFKIKMKTASEITREDIVEAYFTLRKEPMKYSAIIFQKNLDEMQISNNYIHARFEPEDTENLNYGEYHFDIEVTLKGNKKNRKTFRGIIELLDETTIHDEKVGE